MNPELVTTNLDAAGYTWRPATRADLTAIHTLQVAIGAAEDNPSVSSLQDLQQEFDDPWSDPATASRLVFAPDGSLAAYARIFANPEPVDEARAYLEDEVHPDHQAALHDAVVGWLAEQGRARLRAIAAASRFAGPKILRLGTPDSQPARVANFERHGFNPIRYFFRMRRDLSELIPDRPLPAGLTLTTFNDALSERVRQALEESFLDHWGHEPVTPADWQQFVVQHTAFRPDLTPVLLDGDEVAAFSLNRVNPEENARQGYATGWIQTLGTRRPWRKRGLASALLVWSMRAFQAEGLQFATLGVDAENPTGALGLYESLGFISYKRYIAFGLPVTD